MTKMIQNPILRGFNPDPSILRRGDDYYIATSTFEWFPGYQIHHSKDLVNWELITRPLDRASQLDMRGVPDSGGVWAPCLSYNEHNETYYLLYTNVLSFDGATWKDTPNYVVTAKDIMGPWSEPVYLNSSGFDSSFFHDDDGKIWLVNMIMDHRKRKFFGGIVLQEYSEEEQKLIGDIHYIFPGTELGGTEGPHIFKKNGYYYLLTAEGGTEFNHAMTLARSKSLFGPYEVHPQNPIITCKDTPQNYLQRSGHGQFVETQNGEWYGVFLVGRPLTERGRCITGRESAIEKFEWREDDWLYKVGDNNVPRKEVEAPQLPEHKPKSKVEKITFAPDQPLDIHLHALRVPMTEDWITQNDREGYLRLYGRESLSSVFRQSLVAHRVQEHHVVAETCVEFDPVSFQQMAGLVAYYNTFHYHYLHIMGNDDGTKKELYIITCDKYDQQEPIEPIDVSDAEKVWMKMDYNGAQLQFYYAVKEGEWQKVGPVLDGSILSDEYVRDENVRYRAAFTGAFVGVCCQDLSGRRQHADFEYFSYKELTND
ncbi:glycoside hydrolase family 43 protein [Flammeovirga aprica]|nr:glycoside hydrolase family 43 protein [Flammeovirga aprica]